MSRNSEYEFIKTDTEALTSELIADYTQEFGQAVSPASPDMLFLRWIAGILVQLAVKNNYTANQNIPSRAEGQNLDTLGMELYDGVPRPQAQAAVCTERFYISEAQSTSILIPVGTRVADRISGLYWETTVDAYVAIGDTYADVPVRCQSAGTVGNGCPLGQLDTIVDVFDYYLKCENITVSDYGADEATDEEYYELLRESQDGYSCAGPIGAYIYLAKKVSTEIADVRPIVPSGGCVAVYTLMKDGTLASEEIKRTVLAACKADDERPMTDFVTVEDAEFVEYNITLTYLTYSDSALSAAEIESNVANAIAEYQKWQCGKFGRDIDPDRLREYLYKAGIKRTVLLEPEFTPLRDGKDNKVPQVAKVVNVTVINGGYEDE